MRDSIGSEQIQILAEVMWILHSTFLEFSFKIKELVTFLSGDPSRQLTHLYSGIEQCNGSHKLDKQMSNMSHAQL